MLAHLKRLLRVLYVVGSQLALYALKRLGSGDVDGEFRDRDRAATLTRTLERLGATFVKFGQILSTRPDILPDVYIEALTELQDNVPPAEFADLEQVLREELGPDPLSHFDDFERAPLAAASVAQVHRARLPSGEKVAVKIQRPEAREQVERDLWWLEHLAKAANSFESVKPLSFPGAVERFGAAMTAQLDFTVEASNNARFRKNFDGMKGVRFPDIHEELSTSRVLTMEFIDGVRATEPEKVGQHREELAQLGLDAMLSMIFTHGFVHADLHPGNILLTEAGEFALIDLGLVAEIPGDMMRPWLDSFLALGQQDGHEAAKLFYIYAPHVGDFDYGEYERDVVAHFATFEGKPLGEVEVSHVLSGILEILRRYRVRTDPVFTVVNIAVLVAEGLGKQLDPGIDVVQAALPYILRAQTTAPPGVPPQRDVPEAYRR